MWLIEQVFCICIKVHIFIKTFFLTTFSEYGKSDKKMSLRFELEFSKQKNIGKQSQLLDRDFQLPTLNFEDKYAPVEKQLLFA